jgi:hypothetical protein
METPESFTACPAESFAVCKFEDLRLCWTVEPYHTSAMIQASIQMDSLTVTEVNLIENLQRFRAMPLLSTKRVLGNVVR